MSYQSTNIVVYGVELTHEEAKTLAPILDEGGEIDCDEQDLFLPVKTPPWEDRKSVYNGRPLESPIFYPELLSEGTDSRIHSLHLEEDDEEPECYYFGIYVGSKGYAHNDNIKQILKNPIPQQVIDNWHKYCQHHFPGKSPEYHLCNQVW